MSFSFYIEDPHAPSAKLIIVVSGKICLFKFSLGFECIPQREVTGNNLSYITNSLMNIDTDLRLAKRDNTHFSVFFGLYWFR